MFVYGFGGESKGHQAPGFAIFFEEPLAFSAGIEAQAFARGEGGDGHDVPEILGHDVGDEEIYFLGRVGVFPSGTFDAVAGLGVTLGGLYLHAVEAVSEGEDEVVALAVSPGLGEAEAEAAGAGEEDGFGDFSAALAVGFGGGVDFEIVVCSRHDDKRRSRLGCASWWSFLDFWQKKTQPEVALV